MYHTVALALIVLVSVGVMIIGSFYILDPGPISKSFGLRQPAADADTSAWLRLKGIRDLASGLVVLTLLLTLGGRSAGTAFLALAFIPLGDMSNVLASRGSKFTAFFVHGVTFVVMVVTGLLLVRTSRA